MGWEVPCPGTFSLEKTSCLARVPLNHEYGGAGRGMLGDAFLLYHSWALSGWRFQREMPLCS